MKFLSPFLGMGVVAMAVAYVIVRLFNEIVEEPTMATNAAKGTLAGSAWAAISARSGRNGFKKVMSSLRPKIMGVTQTIDTAISKETSNSDRGE